MKFKNFDSFINENYATVNEAKEKFKISPAKSTNPNGKGAFLVKYVGTDFDENTMEAFLLHDPVSAPTMQKVKQEPNRYFFVYKTLRSGENRLLAPNTKVWSTYLELIDSMNADGSQSYVGFNKPPYENFVKWTDVEKLANRQDPDAIRAAKQAVASVEKTGTQQATQSITDLEKSIAANYQRNFGQSGKTQPQPQVLPGAQTNAQTGAQPGTSATAAGQQTASGLDPAIEKIVNGFRGISMGSRGPKVDQLQNTIQKIADASHNVTASAENKLNVKKGGEFDDIYGVHTAKALRQILGLEKSPEVIDATIVERIKQTLAAHKNITAADITTKMKQTPTAQATTQPQTAPAAQQHEIPGAQPTAPAQPVAQAAPGARPSARSAASAGPVPGRFIDTNIGKIKY